MKQKIKVADLTLEALKAAVENLWGGPVDFVQLLTRERISVDRPATPTSTTWRSVTEDKRPKEPHKYQGVLSAQGADPMEAAYRVYLASRVGQSIELNVSPRRDDDSPSP